MKQRLPFFEYVIDRSIIIFFCLLAITLSVLVFWLDLGSQKYFINTGSLLYMFILGVFIILLGLICDYVNQSQWYKQIRLAEANKSKHDFTLCLQQPVTLEQKRIQVLFIRQYRAFMNELLLMKQSREQHVHFTNQWVHYMKTPVAVIHLLTQQSTDELDQATMEQLLCSAGEEVERLTHSLDMMLSTARLDKFELDVYVVQLHLDQVIHQVIHQHKKSLIKHRIFPRIEFEHITVDSDEKWLTFILMQLVTNAIKYMKDKPGSKFLTFKIEQEKEITWLHVQDEGIGIAEEDLPRIFDAFFTGRNGRKEGDATGMGLYLVKQVCRRLGHPIKVASKLDIGTTVTLCFSTDAIHHHVLIQSDDDG